MTTTRFIAKFLLLLIIALTFSACSTKNENAEDSVLDGKKAIVAYFSTTGRTEQAARQVASITGAELFEISPVETYSKAAIDYNNPDSRCWVENRDSTLRPQLQALPCLDSIDIVFVGYPIWWEKAPLPVYTFIETAELEGKTIVPFATSATSGITLSVKSLRKLRPDLKWTDGLLMNSVSDRDVMQKIKTTVKH